MGGGMKSSVWGGARGPRPQPGLVGVVGHIERLSSCPGAVIAAFVLAQGCLTVDLQDGEGYWGGGHTFSWGPSPQGPAFCKWPPALVLP